MPEMWMDVDTALAEVPVNLLALTDDTDMKTRETAVAFNAAGMDLVWNFTTTGGAYTQTAVTPTSGGTYDWAHQGDGMYSIEIPASGGASINNDTEGFGWFTGICTGVLHWRGPVIGFRAAGLNDLLIDTAYSATRGLTGTAVPAAAAGAAGGLLTCTSANVLPTDSIVAGSIAADAITAAKIADNAIDAGAIASNAITSAKVATGAITSSTFAAGAINAAAIAADAITDAKVASDVTIASVTGAVGSVTGNVSGSVASVATGGITSASFAAGAINAAAIAADAITDAKVASDVTIASVTGAVGSVTGAVGSVTGSVGSVVGNVGGNVVGSVGSVTTVSDKTGYRLSATGVDDVWDEAMSGHTTAGTFGDKFRAHAAAVLKALVTTGSSTTSVVLNATTGVEGGVPSATNDFYNGRVIIFISGSLAGQATDITDYDGSTKALTVTALTGAPSSGDTAVIV